LALFAFLAAVCLSAARPWLGLLAVPALLPVLNFAPWTGWLIVEEFDLLVLAVSAGGHFRMGRDGAAPRRRAKSLGWLAIAAVCLVGWSVAGTPSWEIGGFAAMWEIGGFAGYTAPMNALRVGKSLLWIALLWPLLAACCDSLSRPGMLARFFWAALLGSVWGVVAIAWERAFFPGLLDMRTPYRSVGLFWEMHHGGAALDIYLVLIAPLLAWAWRQTLPPGGRLFLGAFILAFVYACLTSFSRGLVCAATGAVVLHGLLHGWRTRRRGEGVARAARPRPGSVLVVALIGVEVFLVFGADSFMNKRLQETTRDFGGRLAHWERALGALKSPADWLFGIGLGKFPSRPIQRELGVALPGGFEAAEFSDGARGARMSGPDALLNGVSPGRFFAVSQRIDLVPGTMYRFSMRARSERGGQMRVRLCASHLLYPSQCSTRILGFEGGGQWHERRVPLSGRLFRADALWRMIAHGVFLASVLTPGASVEISEMRLEAVEAVEVDSGNVLFNSRFDEAKGRWFPQSFHYFLPWHVDNLYLELLVETGVMGLLAFLCVVLRVSWRLFRGYLAEEAFSIELLACGAGVLALGLIVSVVDMPRVATLAGLFLVSGWPPAPRDPSLCQ
jgi:O-antigen ligase